MDAERASSIQRVELRNGNAFKVLRVILSGTAMIETKVTTKYQTTIPRKIREHLDIKPGEEVEWYIVKGIVVVDASRKIKNPVDFLTSQIRLDLDAVRLVREARENFG